MSRTPRPRARRLAATTAAIATIASLSACGTNFGAQTNQQYQAAVGADHRSGGIQILGTTLVANTDGSATLAGSLLNKTPRVAQLTSISATTLDGAALTTTINSGRARLDLPVDSSVQLGSRETLIAFVGGVHAGSYVALTFEFSDSPSVTINVPVVTRTEEYAGVAEPAADVEDDTTEGDSDTDAQTESDQEHVESTH